MKALATAVILVSTAMATPALAYPPQSIHTVSGSGVWETIPELSTWSGIEEIAYSFDWDEYSPVVYEGGYRVTSFNLSVGTEVWTLDDFLNYYSETAYYIPSINEIMFIGVNSNNTFLATGLHVNSEGPARSFLVTDAGAASEERPSSFGILSGGTPLIPDTGPVSGVPEPANWALLIAGFGLVGATMRRRRYAPVSA